MVTTSGERTGASRPWDAGASLLGLVFFIAILLTFGYIVLVRPDASYVERSLNDVFGLADGAYRVSLGLIPSVDFYSFYGAATWYPTAAGLLLDYTIGGAFAFGHLLTAACLLMLTCFAAMRRLSTLPALVLLLFVFLLVAAPVLPGGSHKDLSWGLFHTRHGWAGLAIVLLYYLEPRRIGRHDLWIDALVLASLLLFLVYLKITFAAAALCFVVANAMTSGYKFRQAITAFAICMAVILVIEVGAGYNAAYLDDIVGIVEIVASEHQGWESLVQLTLVHRPEVFLVYTALALVAFAGRRSLLDFLFVTASLAAAILLLDLSGGATKGPLALASVFLVLGELAQRRELPGVGSHGALGWSQKLASTLIFLVSLAFIAKPAYVGARAMQLHYTKVAAAQLAGETDLGGIYNSRQAKAPTSVPDGGPGQGDSARWSPIRQQRGDRETWQYAPTVEEGVRLLEGVPLEGKAVVAFEQVNPFGVLLGLRPTADGYPFRFIGQFQGARIEATVDQDPDAVAERFFSDADYVMVPTVPDEFIQLETMESIYGAYLQQNFRERSRSEHWRLYERG